SSTCSRRGTEVTRGLVHAGPRRPCPAAGDHLRPHRPKQPVQPWRYNGGDVMKVGIFLTCQYPPGSDMVAALEAQYVMTRLARDRGWDAVATGQHYLSEGMRQIQLVPFLARLAAEAGDMTGIAGVLLATL